MNDRMKSQLVLARIKHIQEVHRIQRISRVRSESGWETIDVLLSNLIKDLKDKNG